MRPQKISDGELLDKMLDVFRNNGFEGSSMQDLADATGLKKPSLYHRFPGGKEEMVFAVLDKVAININDNILNCLMNDKLSIDDRINSALVEINLLYGGGLTPCLFRTLLMGPWLSVFKEKLEMGMNLWIDAFLQCGLDAGFIEVDAQRKATQAVVMIQGSLVVSQIKQTTTPFSNALDYIRGMYI